MLIPKRMFRAYDQDKRVGMFFVLAHKCGPDGKLFWRPDSQDLNTVEEWVPYLVDWEKTELAMSITRINEIPVSEGTEQINVMQVGMNASPKLNPPRG